MKKILIFTIFLYSSVTSANDFKKGLAVVPGIITNNNFIVSIKKIKPAWYYNLGSCPET